MTERTPDVPSLVEIPEEETEQQELPMEDPPRAPGDDEPLIAPLGASVRDAEVTTVDPSLGDEATEREN